jgi:Na+/H+ antiporter NhaD/arsenite permease-like protein
VAVGFSAVTAGVATSVGDPASVLIASASGYSFIDFLTHSLPVAVVALLATLLLLRFMLRRELSVDRSYQDIFLKLNASEVLHDKITLRRVLIVLALVIGLFLLQEKLKITSAFVALVGSSAALLWVQPNINEVLGRVRSTILLFFLGFFVMVGGLEATGTLDIIAQTMIKLSDRPVVLGIVIIWVVAFLSSLVDNVPVTIAMIPVLSGLNRAGVDIDALWWALVFGAVFGGAATVIGSSVNLVIVELSEHTSTPIGVKQWSRWGIPVTFVTCTVASLLFTLAFNLLSR